MIRILKGNDFTMRIPVKKYVNGKLEAFPLPACTNISVRLCSSYRRYVLSFSIDVAKDNVLLCPVDGDMLGLGVYALEVRGKIFGNDWRSNEYQQIQIVDNNASADYEFMETEGENSVDMDTAIVILPPTAETMDAVETLQEGLNFLSLIEEVENRRKKAEQGRVEAEQARVEAEQGRVEAEQARVEAENQRQTDTASALTRCEAAAARCESLQVSIEDGDLVVRIDE